MNGLNETIYRKSFAFTHLCCCSVTQSCSILCDALEQHTRLSCPSLSPRVCSNSWVSDTFQPSHPLSSPSPPAFNLSKHRGLFQCLSSSHQVSKVLEELQSWASGSVLPMNIQGWFLLGLTGLISLLCPRDSQESSLVPQFESISSSALRLLYGPAFHLYMTTGETIVLTIQTFVDKIMSLLFNTLSRFVIAFLPRSKHLLISWLQSLFGAQEKPFNTQLLFPFSKKSRFHMAPVEILISGCSYSSQATIRKQL